MPDPAITFFPVRNGDTTLIRLGDGAFIVVDCNITKASQDDDDEERYDVHDHLVRAVGKDDEIPFVDAFLLTHPDQDHCRGFQDVFYAGDPEDYAEKNRKDGLIRIDELWFSPRVFVEFEGDLCDDAKAFKDEADRRLKLHQDGSSSANERGNRLRIVGYTAQEDLADLEDLRVAAGEVTSTLNGTERDGFSAFIHAPFERDTDDEEGDRNDTSVVWQLRFDVDGEERACLVLMGGDAGHRVWKRIWERSVVEDLEWDLMLAPHHCSWSFFNDTPQEENTEPQGTSLEVLRQGREGAVVVASCKPIKKSDSNPPHAAAAEVYRAELEADDKLRVTEENEGNAGAVPLSYEFGATGFTEIEDSITNAVVSAAARGSVVGTPATYG
jgi:hypothetical protein